MLTSWLSNINLAALPHRNIHQRDKKLSLWDKEPDLAGLLPLYFSKIFSEHIMLLFLLGGTAEKNWNE